jgi:hypothetical protein
MGECGCYCFDAICKLQGPKGITYVIDIYQGCQECGVPAGVKIYAFTNKDIKECYCGDLPELIIHEKGTHIPVIDAEKLKELMLKAVDKDAVIEDDVDAKTIIADGIDSVFKDAVVDEAQNFIDYLKTGHW